MDGAVAEGDDAPADDDVIRASSVTRALNLIGDVWTVLLLKEAFLGSHRFQEFQERLGIPRQTLMLRLAELTTQQILYKKPAQHRTLVFEYHLTPKGLDLYPFILAVWCWHRKWNPEQSFLPAQLRHRPCGHALDPRLSCRACGDTVTLDDITVEDGGAFDPRPPARLSRQNDAALQKAVAESDPLPVATSLIGDRWSNLVLFAIYLGVRNFFALQKELKISSNILSSRLKKLTTLGLIDLDAASGKRKLEYRLTDQGRDVYPMIQTLITWGDRWLAGPDGPPQLVRHKDCGALLDARYVCSACGGVIRAWDVAAG